MSITEGFLPLFALEKETQRTWWRSSWIPVSLMVVPHLHLHSTWTNQFACFPTDSFSFSFSFFQNDLQLSPALCADIIMKRPPRIGFESIVAAFSMCLVEYEPWGRRWVTEGSESVESSHIEETIISGVRAGSTTSGPRTETRGKGDVKKKRKEMIRVVAPGENMSTNCI